jgi:hypothetical protein
MTDDQRRNALADMELIACGEELDLPWRRVPILLDHDPSSRFDGGEPHVSRSD